MTSFIGREREIGEVGRLLEDTRLLTVTGPGGVGKTRLTIEVPHGARTDEVWFVELAPLLDCALVPSAIASVLGLTDGTTESLLATVIRHLQSQRALLILDNCEHLLTGCAAAVERLLRGCPLLTILATSREPLGVPGEVVLSLAPLTPDEGVALFLDRATAAEAGFNHRPESAVAIESICRQLDCLPLAIELAASCARTLTADEIATRLGHRFELLASRSRTAPARHQTLQALIDWSYELLSPQEQQLYRRLSVFVGGCALDAIEGICLDQSTGAAAFLASLRGLVEKSLVVADQQDGESRYRMLETLRQHGAERLQEAGEEAVLRTRHLHWLLQLAERGEQGLRGPDEERWRRRLLRELDNCRSALIWSCGEPNQQDAGLGLAAALRRSWWLHGYSGEGAGWLERLLAGGPPNATRAKALAAAAWLALRRGDPAAQQLADAALCLARELGDQPLIVTSLGCVGDARFVDGDLVGARAALEEGLTLAEEIEWPYERYPLLRLLGRVMAALGRSEEAVACLRQALELAHDQQDLHMVALVQGVLGEVLLDIGDVAAARRHLEGGLALGPYPPAVQTAQALALFAGLAVAEGDMARAITLAGAATGSIEATQGHFPPRILARLQRDLKPAHEILNPIACARAWAEGAAMHLGEAVSYALRHDITTPILSPLTEREREVATLLTQGLSNRSLATQLIISERTAKRHVEKILAKLGLRSRAQIADWAIRMGLVRTGDTENGPR